MKVIQMQVIQCVLLLMLLGGSALADELRMVVTDDGIKLPASIQSGYTRFVLDNQAGKPYANEILRVQDGVDGEAALQDLIAVFRGEADEATANQTFMSVTPVSGAVITLPGASRQIGVVLDPGTYLVYADWMDPEGPGIEPSHTGVINVEQAAAPAPEPTADLEIKLAEYAFALPAALPAGTHQTRLENIGQEPHLGFIFKLPAGITEADVHAAMASGGEPDWIDWSTAQGVHLLGAGQVTYLDLTFEPGASYLFDCPIANDEGITHDELGMQMIVTIPAD